MLNILEIMKLLGVTEEIARRIENQMALNGLDFSECSTSRFNKFAREAYKNLKV
jgi:hypothetical protein